MNCPRFWNKEIGIKVQIKSVGRLNRLSLVRKWKRSTGIATYKT